MQQKEVRNRRFSVIGGARSGIAVAVLLKSRGARVFLSDQAPAEKMHAIIAELERNRIPYEFGVNSRKILETEVIVLSPGVPSDIPLLREAANRGIKVVGEVEVASWFCPADIIAVTGTNGKTTTTTLIGRIFEDAKRPSVVAGNIGVAFSEVVTGLTEEATAILEISSFQLDTIDTFKPDVAVLLNITPDHLDRYGSSFERYVASKCRIFENQRKGDVLIYNWDDPVVRRHVDDRLDTTVTRLPFSVDSQLHEGAFIQRDVVKTIVNAEESEIIPAGSISIRGRHNLYNSLAASLAAKAMSIPTASLRATLRNFKGVEHRLEFVRERNGVSYVNDSKATNVDSVRYALQSFERPIVLLLGGRDKGNDYSALRGPVEKHVRAIIAIGESADKVTSAFSRTVPVSPAASMGQAVEAAARVALPGDVVLLSPACASFDWFQNYEHRGRVFKDAVMNL